MEMTPEQAAKNAEIDRHESERAAEAFKEDDRITQKSYYYRTKEQAREAAANMNRHQRRAQAAKAQREATKKRLQSQSKRSK